MILHGHLDTQRPIAVRVERHAIRRLDTRVLAFCRIPPQSVYQERSVHVRGARIVIHRDGRFDGRAGIVHLRGRRRGRRLVGTLTVSYDRARCTAHDSFVVK